ncbi:hypothetical protein KR032_001975, partial [Drosophila birchii]
AEMRCSAILILGLIIQHKALAQFLEHNCGFSGVVDKIIGGTNATHGAFPWMAYLYRFENDFTCGGSLIHKRKIWPLLLEIIFKLLLIPNRICVNCCSLHREFRSSVSIIHVYILCSLHMNNYHLSTVRLGEYYTESRADSSTVYTVTLGIRNRLYNKAEHINDIGVLRLNRDVQFNANIRPVCILTDNSKLPLVSSYTVTGWGRTANSRISAVLQMLQLQDIDPINCLEHMGLPLGPGQICAAHRTGDTCLGDSGGPLVHSVNIDGTLRYVQYGLVSYGVSECVGAGVYTRVHHYVDWIQRVIEYGL